MAVRCVGCGRPVGQTRQGRCQSCYGVAYRAAAIPIRRRLDLPGVRACDGPGQQPDTACGRTELESGLCPGHRGQLRRAAGDRSALRPLRLRKDG